MSDDNVLPIRRGRPIGAGAGRKFNPLATEGYSPHHFYTGSTDDRGHGEKVHVRMPMWLEGVMGELKRQYPPYSTNHAIVRDALVHRVHWLHENEGELSARAQRLLAREMQLARQHWLAEELAQLDALAEACITNMQNAIAKRAWGRLAEVLDEVGEAIEDMEGDARERVRAEYEKARETWRGQSARKGKKEDG